MRPSRDDWRTSARSSSSVCGAWPASLAGGMPNGLSSRLPRPLNRSTIGRVTQVEGAHRRREREHDRLGARDRRALRRELADDDVQDRDEREGQRARERDAGDRRAFAEDVGEDLVEGALAGDAQTQGGERDAELAGREVGVDVVDGVLDGLGARAAVRRRQSSTCVGRTRAIANSLATKKPFAATRAKAMTICSQVTRRPAASRPAARRRGSCRGSARTGAVPARRPAARRSEVSRPPR